MTNHGSIRVGVGGWTFEPWRGSFYPKGLPQAQELRHASRALNALEINGTYYSLQKPSTFAKWRDETPDDFVFTVKAHRLTTQRRELAQSGESIQRFLGSGLGELGAKLGPILWQLPTYKRFDAQDLEAFFRLLPNELAGRPLRHVLDARHESFRASEYLALARRYGVSTVFTDSPEYPPIADLSGPVVYLRMMRTRSELPEGCEPGIFAPLAACARAWCAGQQPEGLPLVEPGPITEVRARDVFMFFISGAKERAPMAALALRRALAADGLPS